MNKSYLYCDDKILIFDENLNKKEYELRDNIKELLLLENLIEMIDIYLDDAEYEIDKIDDEESQRSLFKNFIFSPLFMTIPYISNMINNQHNYHMIDTILGPISMDMCHSLELFAIGIILLNISDYKIRKENKKELKEYCDICDRLREFSFKYQLKYEELKKNDEYNNKILNGTSISLDKKEQEKEFQFILNAISYFNKYKKILLSCSCDEVASNLIEKIEDLFPKEREIIKELVKKGR